MCIQTDEFCSRSKWSPGVGSGSASSFDEFGDTDSSVDAIKVGGKVVDAGDSQPPPPPQTQEEPAGPLAPVSSCHVIGAVQVPGEGEEKGYTAYLVECVGLSNESWVSAKRFSDFEQLRDELTSLGVAETPTWAFPAKMNFFKSDVEIQAERVAGFGAWLTNVPAPPPNIYLSQQSINLPLLYHLFATFLPLFCHLFATCL